MSLNGEEGGHYRWDSPATSAGLRARLSARTTCPPPRSPLAVAAGMERIDTFRDMFTALERVGLIGRTGTGGNLVVPAFDPAPVWDALALPVETAHEMRVQALRQQFGPRAPTCDT